MGATCCTATKVVDVSPQDIEAVLERAARLLSAEDNAVLQWLAVNRARLAKENRQHEATIAKLHRMLGWSNNEKTAKVLPPEEKKEPEQEATGANAEGAPAPKDKPPGGGATSPAKAKGHGRIPSSAYPGAQRFEIKHKCLSIGATCPKCEKGHLYGLDPVDVLRIFGQAPLIARLWLLEHLRCSGCGDVFTAQAPEEAQGPKFSETAVAMMALLRYGNGQPLNRLDDLQGHLKTPVPASTQWGVVSQSAVLLKPVYDELVRLAAQSPLFHNDDTHVRILQFMGKRLAALLAKGELDDPERTGLFTTGIVAKAHDDKLIVLFFSGRKHAGENLADLLKRRAAELSPPIQMSDALNRNLPKGHSVVEANCLSHGRRNVVDQVSNFPEECRFLLEAFREVFRVDARCEAEKLSPDERLRVHQAESGPVMESIEAKARALLDEKLVEPNSDMGKALRYLLNHWDALTLFLRVPGAPLHNNLCERILKMAIRHRNNSLFYKTERGAAVGDLYMTLIETTVHAGENPFEYLTALQRFAKEVAQRPADWLPWTFRATLARLDGKAPLPEANGGHDKVTPVTPAPASPLEVPQGGACEPKSCSTYPIVPPPHVETKAVEETGASPVAPETRRHQGRLEQGAKPTGRTASDDPAPAATAEAAGPKEAWEAALRAFSESSDESAAARRRKRHRGPIGDS